jgi:hypothetical protein
MRCYLLLLAFYFLPSLSWSGSKIIENATSYIGTVEIGNNAGPEVEAFLKSVGRRKGDSWCAAFVRYILDLSNAEYPTVRSGLAQAYITKKSIPAKHIAKGYKKVEPGWLVIWKKGNTFKGHIGFVTSWGKISGSTIEGNTSSGIKGSQADGDGVYARKRSITDVFSFRIVYFTPTY